MTKTPPTTAGYTTMILVDDAGNRQYCKCGKNLSYPILHRTDGPALDYANGYKAHYKDGVLHGTVEFGGRVCSEWKNGKLITQPE